MSALEVLAEKGPPIFDLFVPGVQNILMEKKLESAIRSVESIKSVLAAYGLQVDYKKYFEQKLQVPLEAARALSEVETQVQRELLQNLFARHISGQYEEDGHYAAFIHIINDMDTLDVKILLQIEAGEDLLTCGYSLEELGRHVKNLYHLGLVEIYHEVNAPRVDKEMPTEIDCGDSSTCQEETTHITWGMALGEQRVVQLGAPYISLFGRAFLDACTKPLTAKGE